MLPKHLDKPATIPNTLNEKFPHIKDFPKNQEISIFQRGTMIGDDDVFNEGPCTTSLSCHTQTGQLLSFPGKKFMRLKKNEAAWTEILGQVAYKKFRQCADDIEATEKEFID